MLYGRSADQDKFNLKMAPLIKISRAAMPQPLQFQMPFEVSFVNYKVAPFHIESPQ